MIFLRLRRFVLFLATAGDQTDRLFQDNLEAVVQQDEAMRDACTMTGNQIYVPSTRSRLDVAKSTSHRSITGGGYTHIVLEEARDLDPRTVAAAVLSIRDQNGYECQRGHASEPGIGDTGHYLKNKCPVCGDLMVPWYPRIIVPSSSGIIEDSSRDWFNQLVELVDAQAPWAYYLYRTEVTTNPAVRQEITTALEEGFGQVEALKDYMAVELGNTPRRKGDDFITRADIKRIQRADIISLEGCSLECVGFLDTSWSNDLTSLVIAGWDPEECEHSWQVLRVLHWQIWEPKRLPGGVIDPSGIQAHLDRFIPYFPRLRFLMVDDRGMQWAKDLVVYCNRERSRTYGGLVKLFHGKKVLDARGRLVRLGKRVPGLAGGEEDRAKAWQFLHYRIVSQPDPLVLIPRDKLFAEELLGVTRIEKPDGTIEIRDRNRRKRHADVVDALAGCCLLAYVCKTRPVRRFDEIQNEVATTLKDIVPPMVTAGIRPDRWFLD